MSPVWWIWVPAADSIYAANVLAGGGSISGGAGADTFLISTLSDTAIYGGADQGFDQHLRFAVWRNG